MGWRQGDADAGPGGDILNAYIQIPPHLLSGGPSWIDSEAYDVDAKPATARFPRLAGLRSLG
jgi:Protein of unknown function (DUF3738)